MLASDSLSTFTFGMDETFRPARKLSVFSRGFSSVRESQGESLALIRVCLLVRDVLYSGSVSKPGCLSCRLLAGIGTGLDREFPGLYTSSSFKSLAKYSGEIDGSKRGNGFEFPITTSRMVDECSND